MPLFIVPLFITDTNEKQSKCPSTFTWINKMWYVQTLGYHLAVEKGKILICADTWMNLKNTILSERSQIQKTKNCMTPFVGNVYIEQIRGALGVGLGTDCMWTQGNLRGGWNCSKIGF